MDISKIFKVPGLIIDLIEIIFFYIISLFYRDKYGKSPWIICERGTEAKDNGYRFFEYIRNNKPNKNVYYLIEKNIIKIIIELSNMVI